MQPHPLVINGNIFVDSISDLYAVGHNVSYDSGYLLQGAKTMTCTEDGVWVSSDNDAGPVCLIDRWYYINIVFLISVI